MNALKTTGALLGCLAALCLLLVQFLPWGGVETEGGSVFGFTFPGASVQSHTWEMRMESGGEEESEGWYDSDADGEDGVAQIRTAIPLLLAGLVLVVVGTLLAFLRAGAAGPIVLLVGALLAAGGTLLFSMGTDSLFDGEQDWGASFYLAIIGSALAILGGVLALGAGNQRSAAGA